MTHSQSTSLPALEQADEPPAGDTAEAISRILRFLESWDYAPYSEFKAWCGDYTAQAVQTLIAGQQIKRIGAGFYAIASYQIGAP